MNDEPTKSASIPEITVSNMLSIEALMRVLIRKGLVTEAEVLEELDLVHADHMERQRTPEA
jgi:hypothetical protein